MNSGCCDPSNSTFCILRRAAAQGVAGAAEEAAGRRAAQRLGLLVKITKDWQSKSCCTRRAYLFDKLTSPSFNSRTLSESVRRERESERQGPLGDCPRDCRGDTALGSLLSRKLPCPWGCRAACRKVRAPTWRKLPCPWGCRAACRKVRAPTWPVGCSRYQTYQRRRQ